MTELHNTRRAKVVFIRPDAIVDMFASPRTLIEQPGATVVTYHFPDLEPGYRVHSAHWNDSKAGWNILVSHPDWPEVPLGEMIPEMPGIYRCIPITEEYRLKAKTYMDRELLL